MRVNALLNILIGLTASIAILLASVVYAAIPEGNDERN